jgi:hypothetical protein
MPMIPLISDQIWDPLELPWPPYSLAHGYPNSIPALNEAWCSASREIHLTWKSFFVMSRAVIVELLGAFRQRFSGAVFGVIHCGTVLHGEEPILRPVCSAVFLQVLPLCYLYLFLSLIFLQTAFNC